MGDIGDVWNMVKDTATLFANGQSVQMGARAFACPKGLGPSDLDWSSGSHMELEGDELEWTNWAKEYLGLSTGTKLRFGAVWDYGGRSKQHPGAYLANAYLYAIRDYASAGVDFTITGGFMDPLPKGSVVELPCWVRIEKKQFWMEAGTWQYEGAIRGNGSGYFRAV